MDKKPELFFSEEVKCDLLDNKYEARDYLLKVMALKRKHDENGTTDDLSIDEEIYQQNMLNAFGDVGDEEMYRLYTGYIDDENVEDDDKLCQLRDDLCDFLFFVGKECYGNKELLMELMSFFDDISEDDHIERMSVLFGFIANEKFTIEEYDEFEQIAYDYDCDYIFERIGDTIQYEKKLVDKFSKYAKSNPDEFSQISEFVID